MDLTDGVVFTGVFEEHSDAIFRYLARRVGTSLAEDLTSETFRIAWTSAERYDPALGAVRAWLFGIATNLVRRHGRTEERQLRAFARYGVDPDPVLEEHAILDRVTAPEELRRLAEAMADLSGTDRDLLNLHIVCGLSNREIADALDWPIGTVFSRLSRARKRLRRATGLGPEGPAR